MQHIICQNQSCKSPFEQPNLITVVTYPDDFDSCFQLIEKKLNLVACPVCEHKFYYSYEGIFIIDRINNKLLAIPTEYQSESKIREFCDKHNLTPEFSDTLPNLRLKFINSLIPVLFNLDKLFNEPNSETFIPALPFQLRLLLSATRGHIKLHAFDTEKDNEYVSFDIKDMYLELIEKNIDWLLLQSIKSNELLNLLDKLNKSIPNECISDDILLVYLDRCNQNSYNNFQELITIWGANFLNATLHCIANKENPKQRIFTEIVNIIWDFSLNDKTFDNESKIFLLNSELGQKLLSFQILFDLNVSLLNQYNGKKDILGYKEFITQMFEKMKFYGWEKLFNDALLNRLYIKPSESDDNPSLTVKVLFEQLLTELSFNSSGENYLLNGISVSSLLSSLLNAKNNILDIEMAINICLEAADKNQDYVSAIEICTKCIKELNLHREFELSVNICEKVLRYKSYFPKLKPLTYFNVLNECGNTFRYQFHLKEALSFYEMAEETLLHLSEDKIEEGKYLIKRNKAIIYRDLGDYRKSIRLFLEVFENDKNNFGLAENIASFYFKINEPELALKYLQPFEISKVLSPLETKNLHSSLTRTYLELNQIDKAIFYIDSEYKSFHTFNFIDKCQFLNIILKSNLREDDLKPLFNLDKVLNDFWNSEKYEVRRDIILINTYFFAIRWYLYNNSKEKASEIFNRFKWIEDIKKVWQFQFIILLFYYETRNYDKLKYWFITVLEDLHLEIPINENNDFSISWLKDKEEYQAKLLDIAYFLFKKEEIPITDLLRVIEFTNGIDISSKLVKNSDFPHLSDTFEIIFTQYPRTNFFIFFEVNKEIKSIHISTQTKKINLIDDSIIDVSTLEHLSYTTRTALKNASPSHLLLNKITNKKLQPYFVLMKKIGAIIEQQINNDTQQIYFSTDKNLINLPLHLAIMTDESYLIEKVPVLYTTNLSSLALMFSHNYSPTKSLGIISVPKNNDNETFKSNINSCCSNITELSHINSINTSELLNESATIDETIKLMDKVDEIIFICHGVESKIKSATGICLSYNNMLPPNIIPSEGVSFLENFVLTWQKLENLVSSPKLIVSLACSSGITNIGKGGSQFGLEQSLFEKGCQTIISPIWDVEQESAIFWLNTFYRLKTEYNSYKIGKIYQMTCLETKNKFPHYYFWSPFILKGSSN